MNAFMVVIPARFGASRFPGKPLAELAGEPMIRHVWRRAGESGAARVVVATDDARIHAVCEGFGAEVIMTRRDHRSGTDRLAEVVQTLAVADDTVVVNLQGDEPLMPPAFIRRVAEELHVHSDADISTLVTPITRVDQLHDPNVVKVVRDGVGRAMYFSRAPIPWNRDAAGRPSGDLQGYWRHLGIYAYRAHFLRTYPELDSPLIEQWESLEQLRALWHGATIITADVSGDAGPGVDSPDDLAAAAKVLRESEAHL
ncbi:MAG: 3-deoxy-manno-octulosonate cytidylyltransferase [Aquisalimonadaceae bacterium]